MRRRSALALLLPLMTTPANAAGTTRATHPVSTAAAAPATLELRLNELDYDQPGLDTAEFVEIVNAGSERLRLRRVALVLVNGTTSAEYRRVPLSGRLGPGRRLVVATSAVSVDDAARVLPLPLARDNIQNGAPDGIALVDLRDDVVLDALAYEGSIEHATIDGLPGTFPLGTGQPVRESDGNEVVGSLCRLPDRADTGDDDRDWSACDPTPGAVNAAEPLP